MLLFKVSNMADYMKIFLVWLVSISICLHRSLASEEPEDDEEACGFPGTPANGLVKPYQDSYFVGDVVTYSCKVGHILLGAPVSKCEEDGTWSEDIPVCDDSITALGKAYSTLTLPGHPADMAIDRRRDTCAYLIPDQPGRWWRIELGKVHKILSVAITLSSNDDYVNFIVYVNEIDGNSESYKPCGSFHGKFGSLTLLLACDEGRGLKGEKVHIEDFRLTGFFEICEVEVQVKRDTPYECGDPDRRLFSRAKERTSEHVEYDCKTGYELDGDSERKCFPSGQWSGEPPVCKPIVCKDLKPLENGELTYHGVDGDIPLEGSTVTYKCDYGHKLVGSSTRHCLRDGSWNGGDPSCRVIHCPIPENYQLVSSTTRVGGVAKLLCKKGIIEGNDTRISCTSNGQWTKPKAKCIPIPEAVTYEMVNFKVIQFGWAVAAIMLIVILTAFYVVKRRRDANKPELPSRQLVPPTPPPRPPPRSKGFKSALMDLVSRDSAGYKYETLNLENAEGGTAWKTRSLPLEPGDNEGAADDVGAPRRTMSYDDPEKLASRETGGQQEKTQQQQSVPEEKEKDAEKQDSSDQTRVTTPEKGGGEYAAVDYDKKRQSRLLKEQDSEDRSHGASSAGDGEQLRELPPIPKEEEEEETRAPSAPSPSTDKEKELEEVASVESEDVSLPIAPSDSQTSEAPTPSPDVVIENQVEGPSASPSTPTSETTPRRSQRRPAADQPSTEEVPETRRTRGRRRTESKEPESPSPAPPPEEERPTRRPRAGRAEEPETPPAAPAEEERPTRRARAARQEEPESPSPAAPAEEERPARRTRPWAAGRFETPSTTSQPSSRRRY